MRLEQFYTDTGSSLDTAAWESMLTLNEPSAMVAIDEVHSACANGSVRNPSAFFSSVAKKHRLAMEQGLSNAQPRGGGYGGRGGRGGDRGGGYGGPPSSHGYGGPGPGGNTNGGGGVSGGSRGGGYVDDAALRAQLPSAVYQRMQSAYGRGKFNLGAIDQRALDTLLKLDEQTALSVVDEIESTDLGRVRNFAGYLMGICNKFLKGGAPGAPRRY